jgi:hypothetical protein
LPDFLTCFDGVVPFAGGVVVWAARASVAVGVVVGCVVVVLGLCGFVALLLEVLEVFFVLGLLSDLALDLLVFLS